MIRFILSMFHTFVYICLAYLTYPVYRFTKGRFGYAFYRSYGRFLLFLGGVNAEVEGIEHIDPEERYLVVSNHQSLYDIPILFALLPLNLRLFAKMELGKVPVFGPILKFHEHVMVDRRNKRDAVRSIKRAVAIAKRFSFAIFPEGTRSKDGKVNKFKVAGLTIGLKAQVPILPVAIKGSGTILAGGKGRVKAGKIAVKVFPPLAVDKTEVMDRKELAEELENSIRSFVE